MSQPKHGSAQSYIIGFILSLEFSLIPYYMVVHKTLSGNALLFAILGFAFLQMLIQITFFLHLGRGPKPNWNLYFFVSTAGIIAIVVGGSILIMSNLHYNMQPSEQTKKIINDEGIYQINGELTGACQRQYTNHQIHFKDGQAVPSHTEAGKCDTLTFISEDGAEAKITFGTFPDSSSYAGENNLSVQKGHNETITLSETGTFEFYDHENPQVKGSFTVTY